MVTDLVAVHARHHDVEQDNVGVGTAGESNTQRPIQGRQHLAPGQGLPDDRAQGGQIVRVIVNGKQLHRAP